MALPTWRAQTICQLSNYYYYYRRRRRCCSHHRRMNRACGIAIGFVIMFGRFLTPLPISKLKRMGHWWDSNSICYDYYHTHIHTYSTVVWNQFVLSLCNTLIKYIFIIEYLTKYVLNTYSSRCTKVLYFWVIFLILMYYTFYWRTSFVKKSRNKYISIDVCVIVVFVFDIFIIYDLLS